MNSAVKKMYRSLPSLTAVMLFLLLMLDPTAALDGARKGLSLCALTIIPSLFPFIVISSLLAAVGIPSKIGIICAPLMSKLFSVSGSGAVAFVLGLSGGYPLGAAVISDMLVSGEVNKKEAEHLLSFCNNSGPAFIVGAAGVGVFASSKIGIMLYIIHILAAILVGILFSSRSVAVSSSTNKAEKKAAPLSQALPACVKSGVTTVLMVCGFVVFFSVITRILDSIGIFMTFAGSISQIFGAELSSVRAFLTGLLELGSGIGTMSGIPASPSALALAAFILGWGGLSVHLQTMSVIDSISILKTRYFPGKLLHGLISSVLAFSAASFLL